MAITDAAGPPAQADPTNDSPIVFDVNFNRAVADFNDVSDVELVWTGAGSVTPTITQVTPSYYTVSVAGNGEHDGWNADCRESQRRSRRTIRGVVTTWRRPLTLSWPGT